MRNPVNARLWLALALLLLISAIGQEVSPDEESASASTEKEKRVWGSKTSSSSSSSSSSTSTDPVEHSINDDPAANSHREDEYVDDQQQRQQQHQQQHANSNSGSHIPFVSKPSGGPQQHYGNIHYDPPEDFRITSRVYTDPKDKLAHFDNDSAIIFPYWECGVTGSTTVPIPLKHATVKNLLGGSQPNRFSGEEFGPYPQLVVPLTRVEIVLNSGQIQTFQAGDVILMENVVNGGHKLRGHDQQDMTVLILTLTQHYHQVGKDKTSLKSILAKNMKISPCPTGLEFTRTDIEPVGFGNKVGLILRRLQPRSIRRYLLTVVGISVSALLGDFMGKVAPLWLAVVFGGGCFVTGGTFAFVNVGDKALDELEMWQERRQLRLQGPESETNEDDESQVIPPIRTSKGS